MSGRNETYGLNIRCGPAKWIFASSLNNYHIAFGHITKRIKCRKLITIGMLTYSTIADIIDYNLNHANINAKFLIGTQMSSEVYLS